jgi:hypothetical protein
MRGDTLCTSIVEAVTKPNINEAFFVAQGPAERPSGGTGPPALSRNSTTGSLYVRRAKMGEVGDVGPGGEGLGAEPRPIGGLAWLTRA